MTIQLMGIVNVTPDSFSDGGRLSDSEAAIRHALTLVEQGADILDIGGESTRPGAGPVMPPEEMSRVIPVIAGVRARWSGPISVDTMKPEVARAAVEAGASIWNDVSALGFRSNSASTAADLGCTVVLMHMKGDPRTMQAAPAYDDVVAEVVAYLANQAAEAEAAGVMRAKIWLDPGIGFGKTPAHNLALTRGLGDLAALGYPVLYGASRKRLIQALDPSASDPVDRLGGSLALALEAVRNGASIVRVHDVRETRQALKVFGAIRDGG